jgi:hypothetical protein
MWYSDLGTISIGMQSGLADGGLGVLKVGLYQALIKRCKKTHCPAVDHFALGLFVSGGLDDFGPAAISVDIVVPEKDWKRRTREQLRPYLAARVRDALCACIARLHKDREPIDADRLLRQVDKALADFRNDGTVPALAETEHRKVVDAARRAMRYFGR